MIIFNKTGVSRRNLHVFMPVAFGIALELKLKELPFVVGTGISPGWSPAGFPAEIAGPN